MLERRHLWECAARSHQASMTAGTVMHGSHTPLRLWFWAAYLVSTHQPGISAKQLQRQLGLSRYETAWLILQNLRRAMVSPEREPLTGEVEVDEGFIGGRDPARRAWPPSRHSSASAPPSRRPRTPRSQPHPPEPTGYS